MNTRRNLISVVVAAVLAIPSWALATEADFVKIDSLGVDAFMKAGVFYSDASTPIRAPAQCLYCNSNNECPAGAIDISTAEGKALYSTAQAAFLSGKTMKVFVDGCGGFNGLARITRIDVHRN